MRGWGGVLLAVVIVLGLGAPARAQEVPTDDPLAAMQAERRIALVVGNGAYPPSIGRLPNPISDAQAMAEVLEELGFAVTLLLDVSRDDLLRSLLPFERALREGGVGLFFYAGHAVQVAGRNFLIPVNAELDIPPDVGADAADYVALETVDVDQLLGRMDIARNRLNIVVLDACRDNPFSRSVRGISRGLAQTPAPRGTLIAYSTAPGRVAEDGPAGGNSLYTAALLDVLRAPQLPLESAFKRVRERVVGETNGRQTPWENSSLIGEFYFRLPEAGIVERERDTEPERPPVTAPAIDLAVWNTIKDSQIAGDFQLFIDTYPDSPFAPFARLRLEALRDVEIAAVSPDAEAAAAVPEPEPTDPSALEAALDLRLEDRRVVQQALTALGFDTRGIDGVFGANTRRAIARWQQDQDVEPTGYLTSLQYGRLLAEAEPRLALLEAARQEPGLPRPVQPAVGVHERPRQPGEVFRDCDVCPGMVVIPAGSFMMGSPENEEGRRDDEGPQRQVTIPEPFAIGKYEVTFEEWDACVAGGGCNGYKPDDGWGRGRQPVIDVSWDDAQAYVSWLSERTGEAYRLPSEAEWEYTARAGTATPFHTGATISTDQANYDGDHTYGRGQKGVDRGQTVPVGSFAANAFGLHDVHGNISEWVEDCWNGNYEGATVDGSAWTTGECSVRVVRGGSWIEFPVGLRSAFRGGNYTVNGDLYRGFRVARMLTP